MASIITSYADKHRRSSEELRSDSSSDIEEDARVLQSGLEAADSCEPGELFAAPRPHHLEAGRPPPGQCAIPSVSVSEFSPHQQRQLLQQQNQAMPTPMQINSAIEQAIQQQQLRQQRQRRSSRGEEAPMASLALSNGQLLALRRGSSGRLLPRIPGEQSRSLLDLPLTGAANQPGAASNQDGRGNSSATGSRLDLPSLSPTIRRASAPEGQNIKIVVDDMDVDGLAADMHLHHSHQHQGAGSLAKQQAQLQGELYERLVLYRDDSIEPGTNQARGFGLQVMGGKMVGSEERLQACVAWTLAGGPADKAGLRRGDCIVEWDGKCLVDMTFEQVADVIESSANIAELLVRPARRLEAQANYVRSQRRLSHQIEANTRHQPASATFDGISPARTGTGRRLPQIPGGGGGGGGGAHSRPLNLSPAAQDTNSHSTGQLELLINGGGASFQSQLQPVHSQQQSHSASDLYEPSLGARPAPLPPHIQLQGSSQPQVYPVSPAGPHAQWQQQQQQLLRQEEQVFGLIGLQVGVDDRMSQLEICILSAINIDRNPCYDYYVRVKILPESNRFKPCTTQPSSDMIWKETFIFQNFPTQQIHRMALEIGLWVYDEAPRLSAQTAQPICEALIPIQSARERNTDFWPLRPPPTSPQARRKSLNDLIETNAQRQEMDRLQQQQQQQLLLHHHHHHHQQTEPRQAMKQQQAPPRATVEAKYLSDASSNFPGGYKRERSSSNRNLPEANKLLRAQPRRASDEVATSSSHRLCARISPAPSRRSISVMNVGDGLLSRPSSRMGSQSNMMKIRRESGVGHVGPARGSAAATTNSGGSVRYNSPPASQTPPVSVTPTGRRSSLVGVQSMAGYRSQKNSQSGSTDQDSPIGRQTTTIATSSSSSSTGKRSQSAATASGELMARYKMSTGHRASNAGFEPGCASGTGCPTSSTPTRRDSNAIEPSHQLQRKGSFAMQTLRKLKRTMSLNKGSDGGERGNNQDSRRSSSSSTDYSASDVGEDVGVARRLVAHQRGFVGQLKLTFILTKGQLEVDVVTARELTLDQEAALGIYVKIYLKGKIKSNKRKTRVVQPCDCPVFKHLIKYDGSLVDNKSLEVSVWQRQGGLKGKSPIGFTEIRLSELKLDRLQTSWYNLRPMDIACSSSIDD